VGVIIKENKVSGSYEIEIDIYRNYSSDFDLLFVSSGFQSSAIKLSEFLNKISVSGGQGREAIEVLFQHINRTNNVDQVILIGDIAANTPQEVAQRRSWKPEAYWNQHNFPKTDSEI